MLIILSHHHGAAEPLTENGSAAGTVQDVSHILSLLVVGSQPTNDLASTSQFSRCFMLI